MKLLSISRAVRQANLLRTDREIYVSLKFVHHNDNLFSDLWLPDIKSVRLLYVKLIKSAFSSNETILLHKTLTLFQIFQNYLALHSV